MQSVEELSGVRLGDGLGLDRDRGRGLLGVDRLPGVAGLARAGLDVTLVESGPAMPPPPPGPPSSWSWARLTYTVPSGPSRRHHG